ncbi:50S ribosomal protein L29 [Candidatus Margulisiibacteriota bacterium]
MVKIKNILDMTSEKILEEIDKKKRELCDLKIDKAAGSLKNKYAISTAKKEIARYITILNRKRSES